MLPTVTLSPAFVKFFAFPFLREFGLNAFFTTQSKWKVPMKVYFSLFQSGEPIYKLQFSKRVLPVGGMLKVAESEFLAMTDRTFAKDQKELLGLIHLIPEHWSEGDLFAQRALPLAEANDYCYATDGYMDFFQGDR